MRQILLRCSVTYARGDSHEARSPAKKERLTMNRLRSKLLMVSTFAALLAGTGMAAAQVVDNPPGSAFQDQGIRDDEGVPPSGEPSWQRNAPGYGAHASAQGRVHAPSHSRDHARHERDRGYQRY